MKLIEIPENTNELRDYNKFIHTIVEVQKFNNNVENFLSKVLKDEFFKPFKVWYNLASEEDKKQLDKLEFGEQKIKVNAFDYYRHKNAKEFIKLSELFEKDENPEKHLSDKYKIIIDNPQWNIGIFYCYKTNKFIIPSSKNYHRENFPYSSFNCKPTDDGLGMIITFKHSYKERSTPSWLPTYHIKLKYQIDLLTKSIKKISDTKTETSNKNY